MYAFLSVSVSGTLSQLIYRVFLYRNGDIPASDLKGKTYSTYLHSSTREHYSLISHFIQALPDVFLLAPYHFFLCQLFDNYCTR